MGDDILDVKEFEANIVTKTIEGVKALFAKKDKEVSSDLLEESVKTEVTNQVAEIVTNHEDAIKTFETEKKDITDKFDAEKVKLDESIKALTKEVNELKGIEINVNVVTGVEDPTNDPKPISVGASILTEIFNNMTDAEKIVARRNAKKRETVTA